MLRILEVLLISEILWAHKMWTPTSSFDDPNNWVSGLPEACDRVVLAKSLASVVMMSQHANFAIKSIVFPRTGSIRFPDMSRISFTDSKKCTITKGKDAVFRLQSSQGWLDPTNWQVFDSDIPYGGWKPHREQIPCSGEDVIFKNLTSDVTLPSILLPYQSVSVDGRIMGADDWQQYLLSDEGYGNFRGPMDLRSVKWRFSDSCEKPPCGCFSGSYAIQDWTYQDVKPQTLLEAVCQYARPRCGVSEVPRCFSPVQPDGHCCGVCGSIIEIDRKSLGDSLDDLMAFENTLLSVTNIVSSSELRVPYYIGLTSSGGIQIVLVSLDGDPLYTYQLSRLIINSIRNNLADLSPNMGLKYSGSSKMSSTGQEAFGIIFGTFLFFLSFFGSVYYFYIILPGHSELFGKNRKDPFSFAKFRNKLASAVSNETLVFETDQPNTEAFVNPLFNQNVVEAKNTISDEEMKEPLEENPTHHEMNIDDENYHDSSKVVDSSAASKLEVAFSTFSNFEGNESDDDLVEY